MLQSQNQSSKMQTDKFWINMMMNRITSIFMFAAVFGARQCHIEPQHTWHYTCLFSLPTSASAFLRTPWKLHALPSPVVMVTVHGPRLVPVAVIREHPVSTGTLSVSPHSGERMTWAVGAQKVVYLPHKITQHLMSRSTAQPCIEAVLQWMEDWETASHCWSHKC